MSAVESIWNRFNALPRALRWSLIAALGIGGFLFCDEFIWSRAAEWNAEADRLLARVDEVVETDAGARELLVLRDAVRATGAVERPGHHAEAGPLLTRTVNEILQKHNASKDNFSLRGAQKLKRGLLAGIAGPRERLERLTADVRFNATPEAATAIIAELESRPEIEGISSLRITRHSGVTRVTVELVLEAWVSSEDAPSARVGGQA